MSGGGLRGLGGLLLLGMLGCGQGDEPVRSVPAGSAAAGGDVAGPRSLDGVVVPSDATALRAPSGDFNISGYSAHSPWIELEDLVEDGTHVVAGDEVGRFKFDGDQHRRRINTAAARARARQQSKVLDQEERIRNSETELERKELARRAAELDTRKGAVQSDRQRALAEMSHRQAGFEASATARGLELLRGTQATELEYAAAEVARADEGVARLEGIVRHFVVRAPHDGVVRHSYSRRRNRKVRKGDGMPSGMEFVSIAKDTLVAVDFYVPEGQWKRVQAGDAVVVRGAASGERLPAKVRSIETFPQEIGFLRSNNALPNAREKAYSVRARFLEAPRSMRAGMEVTVELAGEEWSGP